MRTRRVSLFALSLIASTVACASGGPGSVSAGDGGTATTLAESTRLTELTPPDRLAVCDEWSAKYGGYGKTKEIKCEDPGHYEIAKGPQSRSSCDRDLAAIDCGATVAELNACVDAQVASTQCGELPACKPLFDKCPYR